MPSWLSQRPNLLAPGHHYARITDIKPSRNPKNGDLSLNLSFENIIQDTGSISIRIYADDAKAWINERNSTFIEAIFGAAGMQIDQKNEPDWSGLREAVRGVTFSLDVRAKEGGTPYLVSLKVFSDLNDEDLWYDRSPEEAKRIRDFFLDDDDY